jgi:hypothetical protein
MQIAIQGTQRTTANPNICPHCHVVNTPHEIWKIESKDTDDVPGSLSAWHCSNQACKKIFIVSHKMDFTLKFNRFLNGLPKGPDWPKPILELKSGKLGTDGVPIQSRFIKTYLQSLEAQNLGLDELAGMGYRKAIEYLVKDWAIKNKPEEKDKMTRHITTDSSRSLILTCSKN